MINDIGQEGKDSGGEIAVGDLTFNQMGLFMSIYTSSFRVLAAEVARGGPEAGLKAAYALIARAFIEIDPAISGEEKSKIYRDNMGVCAMAVGQALSNSMSFTDPVEVAKICNTAIDCITKVHEEKGAALSGMHLVFKASRDGESGIKVKVVGVSEEEVSDLNNDKVVKLTPPKDV